MILKTIAQIFMEYVPKKLGFLEEYLFSLSEACFKKGIKPIFVFPDSPADFVLERFKQFGVHIVIIPFQPRFNSVYFFFKLIQLVDRENIDLIDFHFGSDVRVIFLSVWLRLFNRKVLIVRHQHNIYGEKRRFVFLHKRISRLKITCLLVHKVIAVSQAVKKDLMTRNILEKKIVVIYNGINTSKYQSSEESEKKIRDEFGFSNDIPIVTAIAYARPEKGLEYLLKAIPQVLKENPSTKFLIVGGGPLTQNLKRQATKLGVGGDVIFMGIRKDIPEILSATNISVLPSLSFEGLGVAILESMSCAKPVVASKLEVFEEVLTNGETGFLVPPRDSVKLAEVIIKLLKNKELAKQIGIKCQKVVKERFTSERMVEETLNVYERLVKKN